MKELNQLVYKNVVGGCTSCDEHRCAEVEPCDNKVDCGCNATRLEAVALDSQEGVVLLRTRI
ncbi:MAG: hypothetical protein V4490_02290 [Pseudomonadota bacterium]